MHFALNLPPISANVHVNTHDKRSYICLHLVAQMDTQSCMHTYLHTCRHIRVYTYIQIYMDTHLHAYAMYIHKNVCMHRYLRTHTNKRSSIHIERVHIDDRAGEQWKGG